MAEIDQFADPDGRSTRRVAEAFGLSVPPAFTNAPEIDEAAADDPDLAELDELASLLAGEPAHLDPRPPQPVEPEPHEVRQALRDALAALDVAAARLGAAKTALHKGGALLGEIDEAIEQRRNAERAALAAAGARLAQSLADGAQIDFPLPAPAAIDFSGHFEAERHREAIVAAHDRLVTDLQRAEAEHEAAAHRVDVALAGIVRSECHVLAGELAEIEHRAAVKRTLLAYSLSRIAAPGRYQHAVPVALSRRAGEITHGTPENAQVPGSGPAYDRAIVAWNALPGRLIENPEYRIGDGEF